MDRSHHITNCLKVNDLQVRGYNCNQYVNIPYAYSRCEMPADRTHIPTPSKIKDWSHLRSIEGHLYEEMNVPIAMLI